MLNIKNIGDNRIHLSHNNSSWKTILVDKVDTFILANTEKQEYTPVHAIDLPATLALTTGSRPRRRHGCNTYLFRALENQMTILQSKLNISSYTFRFMFDTSMRLACLPDNQRKIKKYETKTNIMQNIAKKFMRKSLEVLKDAVHRSIEHTLPNMKNAGRFNPSQSFSYGKSYNDIIKHTLHGTGWSSVPLRTLGYRVSTGACYELSRTGSFEPIPLYVTVVKSIHIPYLTLCMVLGEDPQSSIYELWVNPEFDVVRSKYKGLRPHYRKHIKAVANRQGIPIIEKDNIQEELYDSISLPAEVKSIKGRREWLEEFTTEVKGHLASKSLLQRGYSIELCA